MIKGGIAMPNKSTRRSPLQRWRDEHEVMLNQIQRDEVSRYFSRAAEEDGMEGWPQEDPIQIGVDNGQLVINELYLDSKGDWCTFPEERPSDARIRTESARLHASALLDKDLTSEEVVEHAIALAEYVRSLTR